MTILAIDSSGDVCAVALGDGEKTAAEYHFRHHMDLLRRIVPNIDRVLADCGVKPADVDAIAVGLGPGSFTGLRIGVTVAKTLAYVLQKPVVGIGTLDVIARGVAASVRSHSEIICPMLFARAGEVYWAAFDSSGSHRLTEYAVSPVDRVLEQLPAMGAQIRFAGEGARRNWETISDRLGPSAVLCEKRQDHPRGAVLLELAAERLGSGDCDDVFAIAPLYIRKPTPVVRLETGRTDV